MALWRDKMMFPVWWDSVGLFLLKSLEFPILHASHPRMRQHAVDDTMKGLCGHEF